MDNFPVIYDQNSTNFKDILNNFNKLCIYGENSAYFKDITVVQSLFFFFPRGEIPGYRHTQRAEKYIGTLLVKGERKGERGKWSSASGTSAY